MRSQVYVISDLHLGGRPPSQESPGFQMCSGKGQHLLEQFIQHLTRRARSHSVQLVINGDIVDFLAEEDFAAFTADGAQAAAKLRRVLKNTAPIWMALRLFLQAGGRLTLMLGNHDLELSFPESRRILREVLGPGNLEIIVDNEALVIADSVLIEHGHTYDAWNAVDHHQLRELRARSSRRLSHPAFVPSPGSSLVARVMNRIKERHAHVDLMHPEIHMAISLLIAVDPGVLHELPEVLELRRVAARRQAGVDQDRFIAHVAAEDEIEQFIGEFVDSAALAAAVQRGRAEAPAPPPVAAAVAGSESLGYIGATLPVLRPVEERPPAARPTGLLQCVRAAIRVIRSLLRSEPGGKAKDIAAALYLLADKQRQTFDTRHEEERYLGPAKQAIRDGRFQYVIYGHTHLAKRVPIFRDDTPGTSPQLGTYLNTGTWADLMQVPESFLKDDPSRRAGLQQLLADIERNDLEAWRRQLPTYARIDLIETHDPGSDTPRLLLERADVFLFRSEHHPAVALPDYLGVDHP